MELKHVLIDMDGVLCDWVGGVCDLLGRSRVETLRDWNRGEYSIEGSFGLESDRLWNLIHRQGGDWWAHLDPLPWITELLSLFSETNAEISILTSPGCSVYAPSGKARWMREHIPGLADRLHIGQDKSLLARPGSLLIDDHGSNCQKFRDAGGQAVLFPQPWNTKHLYSGRPMVSVRAQLRFEKVEEIFPGK